MQRLGGKVDSAGTMVLLGSILVLLVESRACVLRFDDVWWIEVVLTLCGKAGPGSR